MGVPFTAAHGSIRFSMSVYNTEEDIDQFLAALKEIVTDLRNISPLYKKLKESRG